MILPPGVPEETLDHNERQPNHAQPTHSLCVWILERKIHKSMEKKSQIGGVQWERISRRTRATCQ